MSVSRYEPSVLSDSEDGAVDQSYDAAKVFEQQHSGDWKLVCDVSGTRDGRKQVESSIRMGMEALQPQLSSFLRATLLQSAMTTQRTKCGTLSKPFARRSWEPSQRMLS
eukprot:m.187325 g.187325  ORF g.187325 m.187325 type:complete len:109 (+) comp14773_c0_seq13:108-434(+)